MIVIMHITVDSYQSNICAELLVNRHKLHHRLAQIIICQTLSKQEAINSIINVSWTHRMESEILDNHEIVKQKSFVYLCKNKGYLGSNIYVVNQLLMKNVVMQKEWREIDLHDSPNRGYILQFKFAMGFIPDLRWCF